MNKIYISLLSVFSLYGLTINKGDIALEFDSGQYHIDENSHQYANLIISVSAEDKDSKGHLFIDSLKGFFSQGSSEIPFQIINPDLIDGSFEGIAFNISENEGEKDLCLRFLLPSQTLFAPGTYTAEIPLKIMKGQEIILEKTITAFFPVQEILKANILVDQEHFLEDEVNLKFGVIDGNLEKMVTLVIQTNCNIEVFISSKNHGHLVLEEEGEFFASTIPYFIESYGSIFSLNTELGLFKDLFLPNKKEIISNINFLLRPDLTKILQGKYRDQVHITISSL